MFVRESVDVTFSATFVELIPANNSGLGNSATSEGDVPAYSSARSEKPSKSESLLNLKSAYPPGVAKVS